MRQLVLLGLGTEAQLVDMVDGLRRQAHRCAEVPRLGSLARDERSENVAEKRIYIQRSPSRSLVQILLRTLFAPPRAHLGEC